MRISHETIYQSLYIQGRGALRRELTACLRSGRALRVPRERARVRNKSFIGDAVIISDRPAEIADRAVPGHWEGDLILSETRRSARSRNEVHASQCCFTCRACMAISRACASRTVPPLAGHGAEAVRRAIARSMDKLPEQLRQSLTWDQGAEMAQHADLRIDTGLEIYFCDPQARGSEAPTKTPTAC